MSDRAHCRGVSALRGEAVRDGDGSEAATWERLRRAAGRLRPDTWALIAIALAVIVANLVYLLDFTDPNPLGPGSRLVAGVLPGHLPGAATIDPNNGLISQAFGHRAMLDWTHLRVPWWNPYEGTGAPLAGEMQSAVFFPPTILTLLANGQLYERILLEFIAGAATLLLLRRLALGRTAATAAGIAFALNGTFAWFAHATINPVPFLPLLLLGVELAYAAARDGRRGGWWLIALAGALSFYGGFPEVAYIDALVAVIWFAWRVGCLGPERRMALMRKALSGAAVGALLAAPLLIAAIDYLAHGDVGFHDSTRSASGHLPAHALPQLLLPYVYGTIAAFNDPRLDVLRVWFNVGGYLSASIVVLGLAGLASRGRRGLRVGLLVWIVLALSRMYGTPVLGHVLGWLPGMSHIFFFRYGFASVEFAVIVLAALGIDALVGARIPVARGTLVRRAWPVLAAIAVIVLAAIGALPLARRAGIAVAHHPYYLLAVAWALGGIVAVAAAAALRTPRGRGALLAAVVAVDAIVLFAVPELAAPKVVTSDPAPVAFLRAHAGQQRFATLGPLAPNYGSYWGLAAIDAEDVPVPKPYATFVHSELGQADPAGLYSPTSPAALLGHLPGYRAAGVAWVLASPGVTLPTSPATLTVAMRSPSATIYHLAGAASYFTASDPRCRVAPVSRTAADVSCPAPATLVRRETDLPGWAASVGGRATAVRRSGGVFQAVTVPAGSHRVTFAYTPPNIVWGLVAFLAGCVWLILGLGTRPRFRRPSPSGVAG